MQVVTTTGAKYDGLVETGHRGHSRDGACAYADCVDQLGWKGVRTAEGSEPHGAQWCVFAVR